LRRNFNKAEQVAVLIPFHQTIPQVANKFAIQMRCMTITKYDCTVFMELVINTFQKKAIDYLKKFKNNQYPFGQWL
jgi:hypothetical protein